MSCRAGSAGCGAQRLTADVCASGGALRRVQEQGEDPQPASAGTTTTTTTTSKQASKPILVGRDGQEMEERARGVGGVCPTTPSTSEMGVGVGGHTVVVVVVSGRERERRGDVGKRTMCGQAVIVVAQHHLTEGDGGWRMDDGGG